MEDKGKHIYLLQCHVIEMAHTVPLSVYTVEKDAEDQAQAFAQLERDKNGTQPGYQPALKFFYSKLPLDCYNTKDIMHDREKESRLHDRLM